MVPEAGALALPLERRPGQLTRVAVLCACDFDDERPLDQCIHWLPGWRGEEIQESEVVFRAALESTKAAESNLLDELVDQLRTCEEDLKDSISDQICEVQSKYEALFNMQIWFWETHQVVIRDVVADGNCGVEMLMNFTENGSHHLDPQEQADRDSILPVLNSYRSQLKDFWLQVKEEKVWQELWYHLCHGMMDLRSWAAEHLKALETTPQRRKRNEKLPFTPDRVEAGKSATLLADADPVQDGFCVPGKQPSEQPSQKKRSGKKNPLETKITFEDYLTQHISERGVSYRNWNSYHSTHGDQTMLFLALMCYSTGVWRDATLRNQISESWIADFVQIFH